MDLENLFESLFRWIHVVAGITWIGLLYFFNWVNSAFAKTMDGETKKKVVPELMPRALFWFRWGAAFTWFSGVALLIFVFYHGRALFPQEALAAHMGPEKAPLWTGMTIASLIFVLIAVFLYDIVYGTFLKSPPVGFIAGVILAMLVVLGFRNLGGFSYRGAMIHLGAMFGSMMAFNVWFRIWPAQKKIIAAVKNGESPDPALVSLAGTRSKHNTYMSVPLIFVMLNTHSTWPNQGAAFPFILGGVVLVGWLVTWYLYKLSARVKGF